MNYYELQIEEPSRGKKANKREAASGETADFKQKGDCTWSKLSLI